eukprot:m.31093 g.31093  ORF g.31093 m.31093 type:complete len:85 (-) comp12031_c0_seq1:538-792(-)
MADAGQKITITLQDGQNATKIVAPSGKPFLSVANAYAKKRGVEPKSLRFILDGTTVNNEDTIAANGIEDGDVIDVKTNQTGGSW